MEIEIYKGQQEHALITNQFMGTIIGAKANSPEGALENIRHGAFKGGLETWLKEGFVITEITNAEIHQTSNRKYLWSKQEIKYFWTGNSYGCIRRNDNE
jgi:hypothetical protein